MASKLRPWAVLFWLLVWQTGSMALTAAVPHGGLLLASPLSVLGRLWELLPQGAFWRAVCRSAGSIIGGFLLACLLAVLLAVLAENRKWLGELLAPAVAAAKTVPAASFIILALVWLDAGTLPLFISGLMVFPPVYLNVLEGLRQRDPRLQEMARLFRVPFLRRLLGLDLPRVLPYFRASASLALGLCWKAGTAAEVIGLPPGTIGERLYMAKVYLQTPDLFAWTIVIVALSVLFEQLFLALTDALAGLLRRAPGGRTVQTGSSVPPAVIRAEGLSKSYGGRTVLKDLGFTAGPGITCVIAPSGAGKTTLLRLLTGLESPEDGVITPDPAQCRWAAVFQEDRLLEDLTAAGNLRFALGAALDGPAAAALLAALELELEDPRPVQLWSGGMRRRLALARALLAPSGALALDEPFTGLDGALRARCMALIRQAAERKPVLLVTHDPADAQGLPLVRLNDG